MTTERAKLGGRRRQGEQARRREFPVVLHRVPGLSTNTLDELAAAQVVIEAPCGERRVPPRPPWPRGAVHCPICEAIARGQVNR